MNGFCFSWLPGDGLGGGGAPRAVQTVPQGVRVWLHLRDPCCTWAPQATMLVRLRPSASKPGYLNRALCAVRAARGAFQPSERHLVGTPLAVRCRSAPFHSLPPPPALVQAQPCPSVDTMPHRMFLSHGCCVADSKSPWLRSCPVPMCVCVFLFGCIERRTRTVRSVHWPPLQSPGTPLDRAFLPLAGVWTTGQGAGPLHGV